MKLFLLIVAMLPALVDLLKALEMALPKSGMGSEKLATARKIIEATFDGAKEIWPTIEKVIGVLVGLFNTAGIFRTTAADPPEKEAIL